MVDLSVSVFIDALERLEGRSASVEFGEQVHCISSPNFLVLQRLILLVLFVVARNNQDDNVLSFILVDDADDLLSLFSAPVGSDVAPGGPLAQLTDRRVATMSVWKS